MARFSKDGRSCGVLDAEEAWTPCYLFLPGTINLKIGVSRAIYLSLLTSAYLHILFSSVSFCYLKMSFQ